MKNNTNIQKMAIWLVVIAVVSLTIAAIAFFNTENYMINFRDRNNFEGNSIDEVRTFGIDQLKEVYIHTVSSDVSVFPTDEEDIKIHFYGRSALKSEKALPKLITNLKGNKLKIEIEYPKVLFSWAAADVLLDIYIPRDYRDNVIIDVVSAEVDISNLDIDNFQCKTVSGDVNIMNFTGNLKADLVSGDIDVGYKFFDNNVDIKTISGKVTIDLPQNAEFYLKTNTVSGEVVAKFPITMISFNKMNQLEGTVGTGDNSIIIDTVSGDIYINK